MINNAIGMSRIAPFGPGKRSILVRHPGSGVCYSIFRVLAQVSAKFDPKHTDVYEFGTFPEKVRFLPQKTPTSTYSFPTQTQISPNPGRELGKSNRKRRSPGDEPERQFSWTERSDS
jgi:hypothetical protein